MHVWRIANDEEVTQVCSATTLQENEELMSKFQKRGLLVEATSLGKILSNLETRKYFIKLAKSCEAVICCRVSPS